MARYYNSTSSKLLCFLPPRWGFSLLKKLFLLILFLGFILALWFYRKQSPGLSFDKYQEPRLSIPSGSFCVRDPEANLSQIFAKSDDDSIQEFLDQGDGSGPQTRTPPRVLLIPKTSYSNAFKAVAEILVANRIKYKSTVAGKNLPDLIKISRGVGKYGVVFFEDYRSYLEMDPWNRDLLDKYCKMFNVGIVAFLPLDDDYQSTQLTDKSQDQDLPVFLTSRSDLRDLTVNASSSMLRTTKGGQTLKGEVDPDMDWVSIETGNSAEYSSVAWAYDEGDDSSVKRPLVIQDHGISSGIRKVLFGGPLRHFVNKLLFLDSLSWLSKGRIANSLVRYILVDIDDVFVGKNRMLPDDVRALVQSQERLAEMVPGFKYNLGFSGGYFHNGVTAAEIEGDDTLLELKDKFWWFPHMWLHYQPHHYDNLTDLVAQMQLNKRFAQEKGIDVGWNYSVAPHHSGVYPVQEQLYEAWKKVWDIDVTSTEEYPHLRPARLRRGFIHSGIRVLPRQTCGLYTKNLLYNEYPGGPKVLEKSIKGGELFETILYNAVNIFMTHMPNYCEDRLAPYTFESVVQMVKCWTNLDLRTRNPKVLGDIYFQMYPEEKTPVWGNPCDDHRHMDIWSSSKSCHRLPNFLVIGPQKTGTTALYQFLQMHPAIQSNLPSPETFEELQFFSGPNYEKGIDWYMNYFPDQNSALSNSSVAGSGYLFEKSATYFDRDFVPGRAHRLLKTAKLIAILISPSQRAYSWYHHMRAHDDPTAMAYTFHQVVTADPVKSTKALRSLQSRCLDPGNYARHLERWLALFKAQNLLIIDGEELKYDPVSVMNNLQRSMNIEPFFDYRNKLRFDRKKGFYCQVNPATNRTKCLGKGKGRPYAPMKPETKTFLKKHYRLDNEALLQLLSRLGYSIPDWLEDDLKDTVEDQVNTDVKNPEKKKDDEDVVN